MADDTTTTNDTTIKKTLWSETLLDILYDALEKNRPDYVLLEILTDLRGKGFKKQYLIKKIEKNCGEQAVRRLKRLLGK